MRRNFKNGGERNGFEKMEEEKDIGKREINQEKKILKIEEFNHMQSVCVNKYFYLSDLCEHINL